ncbi:hypothetical protein K443DRAFT_132861 [Laccaria amethystina LaAM-08-1]|uniref:Uncharacterized protein n=1 Tax=Laccaria amethystina LaAM-08-1 TaxID=1095629 RepID=A0A0C9X4P3_9AGAR|nr:hypothetical protein K443DRAFT_132861 [Laccaria amethystina LaAM-08-1]
MLQKFPHHQGQLNPGTLSAITQGLSWSTMYPTQPLLTGEKSAPPIDSQPSRTDGSMGKKKVKWDDTTLWDDKTSIEPSNPALSHMRDLKEGTELSFGFFNTLGSTPPTSFFSTPGDLLTPNTGLTQDVTIGLATPSQTIFRDNIRDHNATSSANLRMP